MKERDIKLLWGRSGNRCARCKLELTPSGDRETVGEMAHIVGKRIDGPRGNEDLPLEERDAYSNLILLCPTHHRDIDKNESDWPSDKLRLIKSEHEEWVSSMLARSEISVTEIDNSALLNARTQFWTDFCDAGLGISISLTPLTIEPDVVNVLDEVGQHTLEAAQVAGNGYEGRLNPYKTRPSEHGICNERRNESGDLDGYSFHLFRSGHCEVIYALNSESEYFAEVCKEREGDQHGATKLIRYTDLAERIVASTRWCRQVWQQLLTFRYMNFRVQVLAAKGLTIYSYESSWGIGVFGYPLTSNSLTFNEVYGKEEFDTEVETVVLKWIARCFGLQLNNICDERGQLVRPRPFR